MKINISRDEIFNALQKVCTVAESKVMPILSTVLLEARDNSLKISGTNLDIGIITNISVNITEEGSIAVPAKRLLDIISSLPSVEVKLVVKDNALIVSTSTCKFRINSMSADEFPNIPLFDSNNMIKLKQKDLLRLFNSTLFSICKDETRYVLTGIFCNVKGNILTLVSTDGKRLAIAKYTLEEAIKQEVSIIIPSKSINEICKNLNSDSDVDIFFGENQILCSFKNLSILSRLIEGDFPKYEQVLPEESKNKLGVDRKLFLAAVIRASLLVTQDYQALTMHICKDKVTVFKETPDIGELQEEVSASYSGDDISIGFDPEYLIDVLKNMTDEKIELELNGVDKPGVIRLKDYIHILLPMRIN